MQPAPPAPAPPRLAPAFVASQLRFGKIGDGDQLAVGFLFSDATGQEYPPIILTNEQGIFTSEFADLFAKIIADASPDEPPPAPVVTCRDCGARIFGAVAERGVCLTCQP